MLPEPESPMAAKGMAVQLLRPAHDGAWKAVDCWEVLRLASRGVVQGAWGSVRWK